jgi:hypothetical protein
LRPLVTRAVDSYEFTALKETLKKCQLKGIPEIRGDNDNVVETKPHFHE